MNNEIAFELLITELWPCQKHQNGADASSYERLIISENQGDSDFKQKRSTIKKAVKAAIGQVLNRYNSNEQVVNFFLEVIRRLNSARTTSKISLIIIETLEFFRNNQLT